MPRASAQPGIIVPPLDTTAAEAKFAEARALLEPLADQDPRGLINFTLSEIRVALEALETRRRFERIPFERPKRR